MDELMEDGCNIAYVLSEGWDGWERALNYLESCRSCKYCTVSVK